MNKKIVFKNTVTVMFLNLSAFCSAEQLALMSGTLLLVHQQHIFSFPLIFLDQK